MTAGISNACNGLFRHDKTFSFICYAIRKILANTYHTEIIYRNNKQDERISSFRICSHFVRTGTITPGNILFLLG